MLLKRDGAAVKATTVLKLMLKVPILAIRCLPSLHYHSRFISDLPESGSSQKQTAQTLFLQEKKSVGEVKPQRTGIGFVGVAPFPSKIIYSSKAFL